MKRNLQNDIRMSYGIPPYNTWSNILALDPYFRADCIKFWGEDLWKKVTEIELNKQAKVLGEMVR